MFREARNRLLGEPEIDDRVTNATKVEGNSLNLDELDDLQQQPLGIEEHRAVSFLFPTTNPLGRGKIEIGYVKISGNGVVEISFEDGFKGKPTLVESSFGYVSFDVPVGIDWDVDFLAGDLDISLNWFEVRIPSITFLWNVEADRLEMYNSWGKTWVSYVAMER